MTTAGGSTASVSVTLCDAITGSPCSGAGSFTCPVINVASPGQTLKASCGPAGFKIGSFSYSIDTPVGACSGSQFLAYSNTVTCNQNGFSGGGVVVVKIGNGP